VRTLFGREVHFGALHREAHRNFERIAMFERPEPFLKIAIGKPEGEEALDRMGRQNVFGRIVAAMLQGIEASGVR
jgi:hypothetical protein